MLQGTVKSFDPETQAAFRRSGLRKLTLGQRVKFRVEGEGDGARVTYVNILTLPDPA
jgi:cold shock CspA family protein